MSRLRWAAAVCGAAIMALTGVVPAAASAAAPGAGARHGGAVVARVYGRTYVLLGPSVFGVTVQQDPERLPYGTGEFDLVTAVCVYHHVTVDDMRHKLTAEIRRVLKPGGIFCIIEHNPLNPATQGPSRLRPWAFLRPLARLPHDSRKNVLACASRPVYISSQRVSW